LALFFLLLLAPSARLFLLLPQPGRFLLQLSSAAYLLLPLLALAQHFLLLLLLLTRPLLLLLLLLPLLNQAAAVCLCLILARGIQGSLWRRRRLLLFLPLPTPLLACACALFLQLQITAMFRDSELGCRPRCRSNYCKCKSDTQSPPHASTPRIRVSCDLSLHRP
jgi:hypothetical protein